MRTRPAASISALVALAAIVTVALALSGELIYVLPIKSALVHLLRG